MAWTELGRRVKDERGRRGMSAEALGKASGLTAQTVANVEAGDHCPLVATLSRLAEAMGMRPEDLLVAEPGPVDLSFELPAYKSLGNAGDFEARAKAAIVEAIGVDPSRFSVWPWLLVDEGEAVTTPGNRNLLLRVPAASVGEFASLAGRPLAGFLFRLPPPVMYAIHPASSLCVLVGAGSPESAESEVRHLAFNGGCCPSVTVDETRPFGGGTGYLCMVHGLADADSLALQRLPCTGPDGLFVPG